jgi:hypothetical protein
MFRTFQGWMALTRQGRGDGTLQLIPIANAMMYVLLRALQDDVPEDELCGAAPGRALSVNPQYHSLLIEGLSSIPLMEPGDTVFWHSDVVHAVEQEHLPTIIAGVLRLRAIKPSVCDRSAKRFAQDDGFVGGLEIQPVRYAENTKRSK